MNAHGLGGAADLSPRFATVTDIRIVSALAIDVMEGRLPTTSIDHYIRMVDLTRGVAWLSPAPEPFLRSLGRQCNLHGDPKRPPRPVTE